MSLISSSGQASYSLDRTTRSASLPGSIDPRSFSANIRYAPFQVHILRASMREILCSGFSTVGPENVFDGGSVQVEPERLNVDSTPSFFARAMAAAFGIFPWVTVNLRSLMLATRSAASANGSIRRYKLPEHSRIGRPHARWGSGRTAPASALEGTCVRRQQIAPSIVSRRARCTRVADASLTGSPTLSAVVLKPTAEALGSISGSIRGYRISRW